MYFVCCWGLGGWAYRHMLVRWHTPTCGRGGGGAYVSCESFWATYTVNCLSSPLIISQITESHEKLDWKEKRICWTEVCYTLSWWIFKIKKIILHRRTIDSSLASTSITGIHTDIHTYIHTYIHTCIHTYIHTLSHNNNSAVLQSRWTDEREVALIIRSTAAFVAFTAVTVISVYNTIQ